MHVPVFDLYYKYLYYQVVFARVNTWKVLRNSLRWSSWTELACFSGFTRFCPIFLCVCMFIWAYVCPCIYPTKKQAAWRAVIILGRDKYTLPCFLELQQTLVRGSWTPRKDVVCSHVGSLRVSLLCKLKQSGKALLQVRAKPGVTNPFCRGVRVLLGNVTRSHLRIAGMKERCTGDLLLPWIPLHTFVALYRLLLLSLKNIHWKETLGRRQHFLTCSARDLTHTIEQYILPPISFRMYFYSRM